MKSEMPIPALIVEFIRTERLTLGSHLTAQVLADRLNVSRSPVNDALKLLHEKGILYRELNRGYFVAQIPTSSNSSIDEVLRMREPDPTATAYFQIADDLLKRQLPQEFTEAMLKKRYRLSPTQLKSVLNRIQNEGWAQRKPGYGWSFSTMLTTPESFLQSYRLRLALEPAALLEPGYNISADVLARCKSAELHLLHQGITTDSADEIHARGVHFHESLIEASGNAFFIDAIKRVNNVRRLMSYRSIENRMRYKEHCEQHLDIIELLENGDTLSASHKLREHLTCTLKNLERITSLLEP